MAVNHLSTRPQHSVCCWTTKSSLLPHYYHSPPLSPSSPRQLHYLPLSLLVFYSYRRTRKLQKRREEMNSAVVVSDHAFVHARLSSVTSSSSSSSFRPMFSSLLSPPIRGPPPPPSSTRFLSKQHEHLSAAVGFRGGFSSVAAGTTSSSALMTHAVPPKNGVYTVGDFMTKKEALHVVKPTTTVDEALEKLVENRITGFPVIDDDWKLVGVVSDYDLLALDSISGSARDDTSMFPAADSSWKTFNEIQKLLGKTKGKVIADVMTTAPLVVRETTNLEDAARLLLETKFRRLPVVDSKGNLVGIITRGNVVRAALQVKREIEKMA